MAKNDVTLLGSQANHIVRTYRVEDRTTSSASATIKPGEPVKVGSSNNVIILATGEPTNSAPMVGIALTESTETASADGTVEVLVVEAGRTLLRTAATTPGNLADGILYDSVTYDLTGDVFTVDENEGDDPDVHGLEIVDYDATEGTVDYFVKGYAARYTSST